MSEKFTERNDPHPAKLIYLNFHPIEVESRYRYPQLLINEDSAYLFNLMYKSWCLNTHIIPNNCDLICL